ncbi:hypothetical protein EHW66_20255 [Erwinia psidii]|uniref:hypothetical protein n=1 Tax=Erwinia psidii TaxID=69224 RepID=UPI00226B9464|nr:hypothetical protein [Erwinia psidii]MCX8967220.1 hypothetical protein [Erwinia psidii]
MENYFLLLLLPQFGIASPDMIVGFWPCGPAQWPVLAMPAGATREIRLMAATSLHRISLRPAVLNTCNPYFIYYPEHTHDTP